jgi:hypothetical protein
MTPISYARHRLPPHVICHAVWLYLRFTLSYRDVEELLAERGLDVSYKTVRCWVLSSGSDSRGTCAPFDSGQATVGTWTKWLFEAALEALDEGILDRLAGGDIVPLDAPAIFARYYFLIPSNTYRVAPEDSSHYSIHRRVLGLRRPSQKLGQECLRDFVWRGSRVKNPG